MSFTAASGKVPKVALPLALTFQAFWAGEPITVYDALAQSPRCIMKLGAEQGGYFGQTLVG